jgi:hypothetical protein
VLIISPEALVPTKRPIKTSTATLAPRNEIFETVRERLACPLFLSRREARRNICIVRVCRANASTRYLKYGMHTLHGTIVFGLSGYAGPVIPTGYMYLESYRTSLGICNFTQAIIAPTPVCGY